MSEFEKIQWDHIPPDMSSSNLFFTEESYKKFTDEPDLSQEVISKYMELGPYSNNNEFNCDNSKMTLASQPLSFSSSEINDNDLKNSLENITINVNDTIKKDSNPQPKNLESAENLDGGDVLEPPGEILSSCENSVLPPSSEDKSQVELYGRKRLQFPRYSWIFNAEQKFYVSKLVLYKKKQPKRGCPEYTQFLNLHTKVQKEQKEFYKYLQNVSVKFKEDYAFLPEVAAKYMQEKHESILKRLQEHSSFFLPIDKVPITTNHCTTHQLQPVKILLQMGDVPVSFTFNNKRMITVLDYEILQRQFPTEKIQVPNKQFYCHQVCSKDNNAQKLAQKYQCDIVLSSSVFKCLVDNCAPHFEKSWDIPVSVQEYQLEGSEVLQKVVFLDKPFRRQQTTRDINTKFHKISLSARILHPNHMSTHKFQPNSTVQKRLASDDGTTHIYPEDCDIMDVSSLETFGTSISKTIFGSTAEKTIKEKKNSPEKPSLKNKGIESSSKISLSKESVTCSVEVNSDLEPAEETGDMNASPQVSNIGKNQSKEKSQTDTISESSSENALERISKNLSQNEQIQFNSCIQSEENYTNKKIDLMTSCSTEKMQVCPSSEPFEESNRTINFNKVTMINTEHNEKPPIEIEKDNSEDKGSLDASAGHKEITTAAAFLKEDILEDEDSDSDPELVIHFESSDADDSRSENKTFCDKSKVSTKLPNTPKSKITVTQDSYTPRTPTVDPLTSPSAVTIDIPASTTPDTPGSLTTNSYTPGSLTVDPLATPSAVTIDIPGSQTPDVPGSPTPDNPGSPIINSFTPGSPTVDPPATPSTSTIDIASPTPKNPRSPTPKNPRSPTPKNPRSPTTNFTPGSHTVDSLATPSAVTINIPASPTPDKPGLLTVDTPGSPTTNSYTPGSPTVDLLATPSTVTIDIPASLTPDNPESPTADKTVSPTSDKPGLPTADALQSPTTDSYTPESPTVNPLASPSALTIDVPASTTQDASGSLTTDNPGSPSAEKPGLPTADALQSPTTDSYTPESPTVNPLASPSALTIDIPASTTQDASGSLTTDNPGSPSADKPGLLTADTLQTPTTDSYTPESPTVDSLVSPSALTIDIPASLTPDKPGLPTVDIPGSPKTDSYTPESLTVDPLATPSTLIGIPASTTQDASRSFTTDKPGSPTADALESPTTDSYAPGSPTMDPLASPSALTIDIPVSPTPDTPGSPTPDYLEPPAADTPESPIPNAPESPIAQTPASPIADTPTSPIADTPASPIAQFPASPIADTPASPIADTPASPSSLIQENLSHPFDRPMVIIPTESDMNVFEFDDIKPKLPILSDFSSSTDPENANLSKKRKHKEAFKLGPLDSILEKQEELLKTTTGIKSVNKKTKSSTAIPKMKSKNTIEPSEIVENPADYAKPVEGENVTYCIWNFGDLRLLVRCKYSAVKKKKKSKDFVYLMPKLEYQSGFGYEQTTLSEASQMWISSLIRHNCFINRIRINAFSSNIMMEEILSFHEISQLYNPASANTFMYNLFQKLDSLKPGSYFVSHTAGENSSVISKAVQENSHLQAFQLQKMYPENIPVHTPKDIPWVPIDPNLLAQFHEFYGRIPCTFHPPDLRSSNVNYTNKKKKKKKKK